MQHLVNEFSMECLISLIEFQQFKVHLIETFHIQDVDVQIVGFTDTVPKSDIVYSEEAETANVILSSFKIKAHKLYSKYIETGSEYEINIPGTMRIHLNDYMAHNEITLQEKKSENNIYHNSIFHFAVMF